MTLPWTTESVADCLTPLPAPGKPKLQARDYKPAGRYPVVDQGQERIAGWTDDETAVIKEPLPLIVFGDHTRAFKFIDVPFARGADGTQLLKPKTGIDPLFFYYACKAIDLPARGYNRHFTILKEQKISYPDEVEQKAIGTVLRRVDLALEQQSALLLKARAVKHAAMRQLFARGLRNEAQKETEIGAVPASWDFERLAPSVTPPDYGYTESSTSEPVGPKFLRITDVQDGVVDWSTVPFCRCDESMFLKKRLAAGDIVVARIGATTGKAYLIREAPDAVFASYLIRLRTNPERLLPEYLYCYMQADAYWQHIEANKGGRLKGGVSIPVLLSMPIARPSLDEQREIVAILDAIDRKIDLHQRKRAVLEDLFKALVHKLMTGEIAVHDLDFSALDQTAVNTKEVTV